MVWVFFFGSCIGRGHNGVSMGKDLGPSTALTAKKKEFPFLGQKQRFSDLALTLCIDKELPKPSEVGKRPCVALQVLSCDQLHCQDSTAFLLSHPAKNPHCPFSTVPSNSLLP